MRNRTVYRHNLVLQLKSTHMMMRQTDVRATSWHNGERVLTPKVARLQNKHDLDPFCWICKAVSWISIAFLETEKLW